LTDNTPEQQMNAIFSQSITDEDQVEGATVEIYFWSAVMKSDA
jgi:ABC-type phosphate transport system substrate-binding protein